ncbi:MAG TPA: HEAT repeat domain-containing protein, partial [bacterium]|nr:HEAT repeat domain-containing protein [bacterium]
MIENKCVNRILSLFIMGLLLISSSIAHARGINDLIKKLKTGTPEEKIETMEELEYKDPRVAIKAMSALIKLLSHSDKKVQRKAARAIGNLGGDPRAIEPLIKLLDDPDRDVKKTVLLALENTAQKKKDKRIMYAFLKALNTDSREVARVASK